MKTTHLLPTSEKEVERSKSMIRNDITHLPTLPTINRGKRVRGAQERLRRSPEFGWAGREGGTANRAQSVNESGHVVGQDHHRAKLTDHDVWLIHELKDEGLSYRQIAVKFEVSRWTVRAICRGKRRGHTATGQR